MTLSDGSASAALGTILAKALADVTRGRPMTPQSTLIQRISAHVDLLRVLAIAATVLVAMAALTLFVGVSQTLPSYEFIPQDPGFDLPI